MQRSSTSIGNTPVAVVGSGDLVSHVYRDESEGQPNYRFSVLRLGTEGQANHNLRTCDLPSLVKLCQVLAFAIEDDGWLTPEARQSLRTLIAELDHVTQHWSNGVDG